MQPRYYKYYWRKNRYEWYRITASGIPEVYNLKKKEWRRIADGKLSKLFMEKVQEVSEGDFFLECI